MAETVIPVAVWDATDADWFRGPSRQRSAWLKAHALPVHRMYRAEFYARDGDMPVARVFCYALDASGRPHWSGSHRRGAHDHDQSDVAREPPRVVWLDALPPEDLL
jgi:hypothetical protein